MDYPCGKFSYCSFSRFGSIVRTDTNRNKQTDADERFTHADESCGSKALVCLSVCDSVCVSPHDETNSRRMHHDRWLFTKCLTE